MSIKIFEVISVPKSSNEPIIRYTFLTWGEAHGEAVWILNDEKVPVEIHRDGDKIWERSP